MASSVHGAQIKEKKREISIAVCDGLLCPGFECPRMAGSAISQRCLRFNALLTITYAWGRYMSSNTDYIVCKKQNRNIHLPGKHDYGSSDPGMGFTGK